MSRSRKAKASEAITVPPKPDPSSTEANGCREGNGDSTAITPRYKDNRFLSSVSQEQRDQIASLLTEPNRKPLRAIAELTGTKYHVVRAIQLRMDRESLQPNERFLDSLERTLRKELPAGEMGRIYGEIARGEFEKAAADAALRSLRRVEELRGVVTAREAKESEGSSAGPGPMFVVNAQINVHTPAGEAKPGLVVDIKASSEPDKSDAKGDSGK